MTGAQIIHFGDEPLIDRGEGISTNLLIRPGLGAEVFTSGITTFPPGTALRLHTHNVEESVTVLEGEAVCELDGDSHYLKPWDTTFVPAGLPHRFANQTEHPMRILWVYGGVNVSRTIVETSEAQDRRMMGDPGDGEV